MDLSGAKLEEYVQNSETCQFYKNKTLFVTGVTGFCGKVFFEKIARVLFPIKRVYVLIRSKKDATAQERLDELLRSKIFSFHQYSVNQLNKFVAISGDCSLPDLGINDEDKQTLINEVNIVFHCAASVKFDAPVPYNFKQNTLGSKYMVDLIKKFSKIDQFIYVSTAFVNCHLKIFEDEILDFQDDIDVIIKKFLDSKSDEEMEENAKHYYNGRPNSYILTKALAEAYVKKHCLLFDDENNNENDQLFENSFSLIQKEENKNNEISEIVLKNNLKNDLVTSGHLRSAKKFKTFVVRPSIVYNSKAEPTVGWIDSFNGPSGFSIFIFLGLIRYAQMSFDNIFQCVPVDYLANALISIPYLYTTDQVESEDLMKPKVEVITVTFDEVKAYSVLKEGFKYLKKYPSLYMLRVPEVPPMIQPEETYVLRLKRYVFEDLWAYLMDFLLMIFGLRNKISIVRLHKKYIHACKLMDYFVKNHFVFPTKNYKKLVKLQNETDAILFDFDFQNYDVKQIASSYVLGTRRYLLNEPDSTISIASTKFKVQQYISMFSTYLFYIFIAYMVTYFFNIASGILSF